MKSLSLKGKINIKALGAALVNISLMVAMNFGFSAIFNQPASAAGLAWEKPLGMIATSISGPVATTLIILAIIGAGGALAFGEMGGFAKRAVQVVFGGAIAVGAASIVTTLFAPTSQGLQ